MLTVPTRIAKADIARLAQMRNMVNAQTLYVGGREWAPASLVFCGFAGARIDTGEYEGVLQFRQATRADEILATFGDLNVAFLE